MYKNLFYVTVNVKKVSQFEQRINLSPKVNTITNSFILSSNQSWISNES